ncbi:MAG: transcription elongation factor GreA [Polyangiaceae bacterium]
MAETKVPMTPEGQARLREELDRLRRTELPQVVKDIGVAREHGDLSENAEYHAAKDRQGMIVMRISFIEQTLSRAEVIDPTKLSGSKVQFGARLKLSNVDSGEETAFQIVGPEEADIAHGSISVASPLARALLGHEVGDEVRVVMPAGPRVYEILEISFDGRPENRPGS